LTGDEGGGFQLGRTYVCILGVGKRKQTYGSRELQIRECGTARNACVSSQDKHKVNTQTHTHTHGAAEEKSAKCPGDKLRRIQKPRANLEKVERQWQGVACGATASTGLACFRFAVGQNQNQNADEQANEKLLPGSRRSQVKHKKPKPEGEPPYMATIPLQI